MKLLVTGFRTIVRLVQGPCVGNQEFFVLHTELLVSINRVIRSIRVHPPKKHDQQHSSYIFSSSSKLNTSGSAGNLLANDATSGGVRNVLANISPNSSQKVKPSSVGDINQYFDKKYYFRLYQQGLIHFEQVKEATIDLLEAITEAQQSYPVVFERVITTIDLSK